MDRIAAALDAVSLFLREKTIPCMVIGGLANMIWGKARMTEDIDLTIWLPDRDITDLADSLRDAGFAIIPPDPVSFANQTSVLPVKAPNGIKIDLILAALPLERTAIDRAVQARFGHLDVPVCTAEDLIILKAVSTRIKDVEDIQGIIERMAGKLDRAYLLPILRELASMLERNDLLELCRRLET